MNTKRFFSIVAAMSIFGTFGASVVGCSGSSDASIDAEEGDGDSAEGAVKSKLLGDVVAIEINGQVTVAAPKKVSRVLKATGLTTKIPREGGFRCMPTYRLRFLDASMKEIATGGVFCGSSSSSIETAQGQIFVKKTSKNYIIEADMKAIRAIAAEPANVGDVLVGVASASITKPGSSLGRTIDSAAAVKSALAGIKLDQVPDSAAVLPRCVPSHIVTFFRADNAKVGSIALSCAANTDVVKASGQLYDSTGRFIGLIDVGVKAIFDAARNNCPLLSPPRPDACGPGTKIVPTYDELNVCGTGIACLER